MFHCQTPADEDATPNVFYRLLHMRMRLSLVLKAYRKGPAPNPYEEASVVPEHHQAPNVLIRWQ